MAVAHRIADKKGKKIWLVSILVSVEVGTVGQEPVPLSEKEKSY